MVTSLESEGYQWDLKFKGSFQLRPMRENLGCLAPVPPLKCLVLCLLSSHECQGEKRGVSRESERLCETDQRGEASLRLTSTWRTNLPAGCDSDPRWALWHFELIRNFASLSLLCRVNYSDIALRRFIIMQSHLIRALSSNLARSVKRPL